MTNSRLKFFQVFGLAFSLVCVVFAVNFWGRDGGDVLRFFRIGDVLEFSPRLNLGPNSVYEGELGYDGQLFLTLALDPALREPGTLTALDNPRYRYRRILFPFLGHVLVGGNPAAVPYALVILNVFLFAAMAAVAAAIFEAFKKPPFWGLGVMAVPGYWCAFFLATSDLLAGLLLLLSILAVLHNRLGRFAVLYALMILTHETLLLAGGGLMFFLLCKGNIGGVIKMAAGIIPAGIWNVYVLWRIPSGEGTSGFFENFAWPGAGVADKLQTVLNVYPDLKWMYDTGTFLLLLITFLFTLLASGSPRRSPFWGVAAAYFGFFLISRMQILGYYLDFLRVFGGAVLMGLLAYCSTAFPKAHHVWLACWAGASLALILVFTAGVI
jgi:hypothetical protein